MSYAIHGATWVLCAVVAPIGCARWTAPGVSDRSPLAPATMSSDTVVLEVAFVQFTGQEDQQLEEQLWKQVDEQHLDLQLRKSLQQNGLRCGLASSPLPPTVRSVMEARSPLPLDGDTRQMRSFQNRIQSRAGRSKAVPLSTEPRDLVVLVSAQGEIRGQTYPQGRCQFDLRTFPQGDGRVRLQVTPEIEFGPPRTRYIGDHEQAMLVVDSGRERQVFQEAQIDALISPGQTLIIGCTPQWKGLGRSFFIDMSSGQAVEGLLLVRLAQTPRTDLFAPEPAADPLVTPAE